MQNQSEMQNQSDHAVVFDLSKQVAELNEQNQTANERLKQQSEEERKAREEEERERTRALEQKVRDQKLAEEKERRDRYYEDLKKEQEESQKNSGGGLFGFWKKKEKAVEKEETPDSEPEKETEPVPDLEPDSESVPKPSVPNPDESIPETEPEPEEQDLFSTVVGKMDTDEDVDEPVPNPAPEKDKPKLPTLPTFPFAKKKTKKERPAKEKKETPHVKKEYKTRPLTHELPLDEREDKDKMYPGHYEASEEGRTQLVTTDPDQDYIDWREQVKKNKERLDADRYRIMLHDVQERKDDIIVMVLITTDMKSIVLLHTLDEFFQFVEERNGDVSLSYAFVIYKNDDPRYYLEIPNDEHIQKLMVSIRDLFMNNTRITPYMIGQIPNIGIFENVYVN